MEKEVISVIIPVYNGEIWLEQCIQSLEKQTIFTQLEVIFVNDGSTDSTKRIIDEFAAKNENILVIHSEKQGVSSARNQGIEVAKGKYIAFFDVDDKLAEDYYETMLKNTDENCDIICGGYIVEYPQKEVVCKIPQIQYFDNSQGVERYLWSKEIDPNIWDKLIRKTLVKNIRFEKELIRGEDRYFVFQCICSSKKIKVIPEAKYYYVMNDTSVMHSSFSKKKLESSCAVADYICNEIQKLYPYLRDLAESYAIDIKVRLVGEMYQTKAHKEYKDEYKTLYKQIRCFSIFRKAKYSSKKHLIAFLAAKIHPQIYVLLKYGLNFQYKLF